MQTCFSQTHIAFILGKEEHISGLGMKMLRQITSPIVLGVGELNYNGADKLVCKTKGFESVGSTCSYLTEANRLNITIGLAKLIKATDENTFLDREFIQIDRDYIYLNPETGLPGFVVLPITDNSTGSLRRIWLENLYSFLSFLFQSADEVKDDDLQELITRLERQGLKENQDGESKIPDLIDIANFLVDTFAGEDYRPVSSSASRNASKEKEVKLVHDGAYGNFAFYILNNKFLIGKTSDCDGKLTFNQAISRRHGEIDVEAEGCFYTDLGSSNHSYLNGNMLNPNNRYKLSNGDHLRLADMDFVVEIMQKGGGSV
ncbi:FHA domain-containing protein [Butyrivibrio proteoclasticus]|uniref:FHA domain-containing protein n=1 Tax=Butyrivibrio proteoclasticus TaxID=43305 RepID=UPI00047AB6A6|nr:FHA domain-containing protein [Butyrivibrio proteoclasticus]